MKKLLFLGILLLIGYSIYSYWNTRKTLLVPATSVIQVGSSSYTIEIADTADKKTRGLSGRTQLAANKGMLFMFETKDIYAFWMKDMQFPLDFIWIDQDTVVDITENVPPPLTATYLPRYQPKQPVDKVLEINAGQVEQNNIKIGDKITLMLIQKDTTTSK